MSKKSRRRNKTKQSQIPRKQVVMTQQKVLDVIVWLERMTTYTIRAVELSEDMDADTLSEDNHLYWALVKYVENAQESAKQIDNINSKFFTELIELDKSYWKSLRRMRDRLAHKFWDIDPNILWETVRQDFLHLLSLLSTIRVVEQLHVNKTLIDFTDDVKRLSKMPEWPDNSGFKSGHSIVVMAFTPIGDVVVLRVGHNDGRMFVVTDRQTKPEYFFARPK